LSKVDDDIHVVDDAAAQTTPSTNTLAQPPSTTTTTPSSSSSSTAPATTAPTTTTIPPCRVAEGRAQGDPTDDWATIVVDTGQALPASYAPPDLVPTADAGFATGDKVREIVVDDLDALRRGAIRHQTPLVLVSGYRSYARQAELFAEEADKVGDVEARKTTARPGHSEHQLGTTIDVLALGNGDLVPEFADTSTGRWLSANAYRYGFVLSYPDASSERSCYSYEPWHLRYVGRDIAAQIHESGVTPREWMLIHPD
jgi:D-alanyl-D-alanine carboxypeptidase